MRPSKQATRPQAQRTLALVSPSSFTSCRLEAAADRSTTTDPQMSDVKTQPWPKSASPEIWKMGLANDDEVV